MNPHKKQQRGGGRSEVAAVKEKKTAKGASGGVRGGGAPNAGGPEPSTRLPSRYGGVSLAFKGISECLQRAAGETLSNRPHRTF